MWFRYRTGDNGYWERVREAPLLFSKILGNGSAMVLHHVERGARKKVCLYVILRFTFLSMETFVDNLWRAESSFHHKGTDELQN